MNEEPITYTLIKGVSACKWCDKAVALMQELDKPLIIRVLSRADLKEAASAAGMTTVPIIYEGVKLIGGFSELEAHFLS